MFYQYYTLQKVILKTEDIQDDREEGPAAEIIGKIKRLLTNSDEKAENSSYKFL